MFIVYILLLLLASLPYIPNNWLIVPITIRTKYVILDIILLDIGFLFKLFLYLYIVGFFIFFIWLNNKNK
jgi:hypothetical protein